MHHTDRTALEASSYMDENQYYAESPYSGEEEELVNPYSGEVNQDLEVQLAAELLGVSSEAELDQFSIGEPVDVGPEDFDRALGRKEDAAHDRDQRGSTGYF